jgi:hypothetical protein
MALGALAVTSVTTACRSTPSTPAVTITPDTWAVVDGHTITRDDV